MLPYECKMDPLALLTVLFITGLIVESMTGAIAAGEHKMDLFGVIVVASVMLIIAKPELLFLTSSAALVMV